MKGESFELFPIETALLIENQFYHENTPTFSTKCHTIALLLSLNRVQKYNCKV